MSLSNEQRQDAADALDHAEQNRAPIDPLSATYPGLDIDDAYRIQTINIDRLKARGATVVGYKVGLTAKAMQELLDIDQHDYGVILDVLVEPDGGSVDISRYCSPLVEIEIAFLLAEPLVGPGLTADDVLAATCAVAPSIELIDSRIADWRITLEDTIADNASSAGIVLGPWVPLGDHQLADVSAELVLDGEVVTIGTGADVLGHPAEAVAWLANTLASLGTHLEAGHVVLPGSCTRAIDVHAGSHIEGRFTGLGSVSLAFT